MAAAGKKTLRRHIRNREDPGDEVESFYYSVKFLDTILMIYRCCCRNPRRQSDVSSLISALDTTLKMSNVSVDRESPDVDNAAEKDEDNEPLDIPFGQLCAMFFLFFFGRNTPRVFYSFLNTRIILLNP